MHTRFVDGAVAERLLKVVDFAVLALGALIVGLRSTVSDNPGTQFP